MNIFHTELQIRTYTFFGWWSPPDTLLEHRADPAGSVTITANDDIAA